MIVPTLTENLYNISIFDLHLPYLSTIVDSLILFKYDLVILCHIALVCEDSFKQFENAWDETH